MTFVFPLRRAAVVAALVLSPIVARSQDKPHIVVIWGDDIGQSNLNVYTHGLMGYETPNIDRIAAEGLCCSRTTTASRVVPRAGPHSSPGRASFGPV